MSGRGRMPRSAAPGHGYPPPRSYAQMAQFRGGPPLGMPAPMTVGPPPPLPPLAIMDKPSTALPPVSVQQPVLMGTFSYDANKTLCFDNSAKRWYKIPPTKENSAQGADLNVGFEHFYDKPHVPDPLDSVLYTMMHRCENNDELMDDAVHGKPYVPSSSVESEMLRAQVVTWRGIMTKLCTAWSCHAQASPMFRDGFELNVMMLGDTLIMEEVPPTMMQWQMMQHDQSKPKRAQLGTYYGYSFESYCTKERPGNVQARAHSSAPPGWSGDVNTNVQWCHIVKTKLGNHRIVMGGEVDCVETLDAATEHEREGVVELKTNMRINNDEDQRRLDAKMLKMYMQSFLLGVRTVVIGFRDQHGILHSHKAYRTADLPRVVRGSPGEWNANDNLAYGAAALDFIRDTVRKETERFLLQFAQRVRVNEQTLGVYAWRVHRTTSSFLGHLPMPACQDAERDYPVFRVKFESPFTHMTIRYVPPPELAMDGRRHGRCGLVPTAFYQWATMPMAHIL